MKIDTTVLINWISFLLHSLSLTLLLFTYAMPYWYVSSNDSADGTEIAGIWARCRIGGSCQPLDQSADTLVMNMTPIQALMTMSLILCVVTFGMYALWLWKGEGCTTPWRKRCEWCRETYNRSTKPTPEAVTKYGRLKYFAFILATLAGVFTLTAAIFYMTQLMQVAELQVGNIGWAAWVAMVTGILLLLQNGVLSLFFYVLRRPDLNHSQHGGLDGTQDEDIYVMEEVDEKEMERIRKWITEQRKGIDNPSFESEYEVKVQPRPHRTKTPKMRSNASSVYYRGSQGSSSTLSGSTSYRPPRVISSHDMRSMMSSRPNRRAEYIPAYSAIFKNKIPMIPKEDFSPMSKFYYDVIYHGHRLIKPTYGVNEGRPASHLGVTSADDDITRDARLTRSASDTDLRRGEMDDDVYDIYTTLPSGKRIKVNYSQEYLDSLEPGSIPTAYRRRKHSQRSSLSSLPSMTSSESKYRVRTKFPDVDSSTSSSNLPAHNGLSRGYRGMDLASSQQEPKSDFHLDNIWVLSDKEQIKHVMGKGRVHFKLQKSIQELDEFDETYDTIDEPSDSHGRRTPVRSDVREQFYDVAGPHSPYDVAGQQPNYDVAGPHSPYDVAEEADVTQYEQYDEVSVDVGGHGDLAIGVRQPASVIPSNSTAV